MTGWLSRRLPLAFALAAVCIVCAPVGAQENSPHQWPGQRDGLSRAQQSRCPPWNSAKPPQVPPHKDDRDVSGHNDGKTVDWIIDRWHWDDGENDLTVEEWCINAKTPYYSLVIIQSKKGKPTTVVAPGGAGGTVDPGQC